MLKNKHLLPVVSCFVLLVYGSFYAPKTEAQKKPVHCCIDRYDNCVITENNSCVVNGETYPASSQTCMTAAACEGFRLVIGQESQ